MNNLISCGLDIGNGFLKICLNGKVSKIPNWSILNRPKGQLTKTNTEAKPVAFSLEINGELCWFGQDTLSQAGYQEIDSDKYKPKYIQTLFKAVLYRWIIQHHIEPEWLADKRLNIICGMPPEQYQDKLAQNKALKAYQDVFNPSKTDYIKIPSQPAIPFFTKFGGLTPETIAWRSVNTLKTGYTLVVDLGYGTSDICLFSSHHTLPVSTISLNNGLLHSHNKTNPTMPWLAELDTMRKVANSELYSNEAKRKIRHVARQLSLAQLVIFGGGIRLFSPEDLKDLKSYATNYWQGDEFTNVRIFEKLGEKND